MSSAVPIVQIEEIIQLKNDKSKQLKSNEYLPNGILPIVDQGAKKVCGFTNDTSKTYDKGLPVVIFGDHTLHTKFIDFNFAIGADGTQVIVPKTERCDTKYLYYLISRAAELIGSEGYKRHLKILKEFDIEYIDSLPEQKKIASILSSVDDVITKTTAQIDKLKDLKTGVMQELLTKGIGHTEFKDSPVGRIPVGWDVVPISTLAIDARNSFVIGPFGSNLVKGDYRDSGVPVVFVRDIGPGSFKWKSNVFVTEEKAEELSSHNVNPGEVVITKMGLPPGIAAVYDTKMPPGIITADIIRLRPDLDKASPDYLVEILNCDQVSKQVRDRTAGQTRPKLTLADYRTIVVPLPDVSEQNEISEILGSIRNRIDKLCNKHQTYTELKKALMQDLLTGKVRVSVDS